MTACRVTYDLNKWQSEQWDCTCAPGVTLNDIEKLCQNCLCNHPDYFEED